MFSDNTKPYFKILLAFSLVAIFSFATAQIAPTDIAPMDAEKPAVSDRTAKSKPIMTVGTYNPKMVFDATRREAVMQETQKLQQKLQEAQQSGDQQQMFSVQQEAQQAQDHMIRRFEADVKGTLTDIAEETGVKLIAIEIVHKADGVKVVDLTPKVIEGLQKDSDEKQTTRFPLELPAIPAEPRQP